MVKVQTNFRLDEELLTALKERADNAGISTTELLSQFIRQGLGLVNTDVNTVAIQSNDELYKRIDERIAVALQPYIQRIATLEDEVKKFPSLIEVRATNQASASSPTVSKVDEVDLSYLDDLNRDELRKLYREKLTLEERKAFGDNPDKISKDTFRERLKAKLSADS